MGTMNTNPFENIFQAQDEEEDFKNLVDIYEFYQVLYELFEGLGVLTKDSHDPRKISFKFAYPDEMFEDKENGVTFDILHRSPMVLPTSSGGITQVKAVAYGQEKNLVTGQIEEGNCYSYTNIVALEVFSRSCKDLMRLTSFIESALLKHRGILRSRVKSIQLKEITATKFSDNVLQARHFSKSLVYEVNTKEVHKLLYEEIRHINTIENPAKRA